MAALLLLLAMAPCTLAVSQHEALAGPYATSVRSWGEEARPTSIRWWTEAAGTVGCSTTHFLVETSLPRTAIKVLILALLVAFRWSRGRKEAGKKGGKGLKLVEAVQSVLLPDRVADLTQAVTTPLSSQASTEEEGAHKAAEQGAEDAALLQDVECGRSSFSSEEEQAQGLAETRSGSEVEEERQEKELEGRHPENELQEAQKAVEPEFEHGTLALRSVEGEAAQRWEQEQEQEQGQEEERPDEEQRHEAAVPSLVQEAAAGGRAAFPAGGSASVVIPAPLSTGSSISVVIPAPMPAQALFTFQRQKTMPVPRTAPLAPASVQALDAFRRQKTVPSARGAAGPSAARPLPPAAISTSVVRSTPSWRTPTKAVAPRLDGSMTPVLSTPPVWRTGRSPGTPSTVASTPARSQRAAVPRSPGMAA